MKFKHFVFGKFKSQFPEFGVRVCDDASFITRGANGLEDIANYFQNHYRSIFYSAIFPESNPEIIARIKDKYVYARFYPPFEGLRGTNIECLFHAFVFTKKEMEYINYCPWRLKRNFIKEFNSTEIIGYDDDVWLKAGQCGIEEYNKAINIEIDSVNAGKSVDGFYQEHSAYYVIVNSDPEALLTRLDVPIRLSLFSSGILLNGNTNVLYNLYSKRIHFVFLPKAANSGIPDSFITLLPQNLNQLIISETTESNVKIKPKEEINNDEDNESPRIVIEPVINPELVEAKFENGNIRIRWQNNNNFKVNIIIERKTESEQSFLELPHTIVLEPMAESTFNDTEIKNGEEYTYRLQQYIAGTSPKEGEFSLTPPIRTIPFSVDPVTLKCSFDRVNLSINLKWKHPKNSFPIAYNIYRVRLSDLEKVNIISNLYGESFIDTNGIELTSYSYSIVVVEPKSGIVSQPVQITCDGDVNDTFHETMRDSNSTFQKKKQKLGDENVETPPKKSNKYLLFAIISSVPTFLLIYYFFIYNRQSIEKNYDFYHKKDISRIQNFKSQNKCDSVLKNIIKLKLDSIIDQATKSQLLVIKNECENIHLNNSATISKYDSIHSNDLKKMLSSVKDCTKLLEYNNKIIILDSINDNNIKEKLTNAINSCRELSGSKINFLEADTLSGTEKRNDKGRQTKPVSITKSPDKKNKLRKIKAPIKL